MVLPSVYLLPECRVLNLPKQLQPVLTVASRAEEPDHHHRVHSQPRRVVSEASDLSGKRGLP